jgi:hypothetical protein
MMLFFMGHACPKANRQSIVSAQPIVVFSSSPFSMVASIPSSFYGLIASGDDFLTVSAAAMRPANSLSMDFSQTNYSKI